GAFIYLILRRLQHTQKNLEHEVQTRTAALRISEADLRRSEESMRRLLSNLPDVTRTSDRDGRIKYVSANVKELMGFSADEVYAFPPEFWLSRVHENDRQRVVENYAKLFADGTPIDDEFRIQCRDGHWIWLHDRATRTVNGGYHADGIFSDITRRKQAEEQAAQYEADLRQQGERLRHSLAELGIALEAARAGTYDLDLVSHAVSWSDEMRLVYGMQPGEFKGTIEDWLSCLFPEDAPGFSRFEEEIQEGSRLWLFRIKRRDDGEVRWIESRGEVVFEDGRPVRMIGINMDITERKRAEIEVLALADQFRHAQKMEAVGRLAGGMAHDFNNLLMVIRGYTEIITERLPSGDPLLGHSKEVIKAADRAASLTRQLLAFSRKQVLTPVVFDLGELINDTAKMLKRLIGEDVELRVNVAKPLWNVCADKDQITQVVMNLCVNARDAMPSGGLLCIGMTNVLLTDEHREKHPFLSGDDFVQLTVEDTGTGISAEVMEHIFEPFFTTKEQGRGTGLGLSTVYGIIKQSGGYIWVNSKVGEGTTFTVYLPKAVESCPEAAEPELSAQPGGSETILVVEDEEGLRGAICDYLSGMGYRVLSAASGEEALLIAEQEQNGFGLLLTDVVMPKMNGRQLAGLLQERWPSLKTILMSGYIDDSVFRLGCDETHLFLQKPFKLAALAAKIRDILGNPSNAASAAS
ncbi:MAG TPA: PAS domain-containing protein, partial [Terriglobales bacterium]